MISRSLVLLTLTQGADNLLSAMPAKRKFSTHYKNVKAKRSRNKITENEENLQAETPSNTATRCIEMVSIIKASTFKMLDGNNMPAIALGTYLGYDQHGAVKSKNHELRDIVLKAIDLGYRHIDTASFYETEGEVGEAIRMKIAEGVVQRNDIFLTTKSHQLSSALSDDQQSPCDVISTSDPSMKPCASSTPLHLWNNSHKREQVLPAIKESLNNTGLDYVDLYLMHWPVGINADNSDSDVDFMETWRGMEDAQKLGFTKSIGVANFNKGQMQRVLAEGSIKPVALQIEVHPQIIQKDLIEFCKTEGIIVQGYSPFGSMVMRYGMEFPGPRFDNPNLVAIAKKYGKTTAQVVLRWAVDRNVVPLPKTMNPTRLEENLNIFDFKLNPEEIDSINQFNTDTRYTLPSFWQETPYYPFEKIANPIGNPFIKS